MIGIADDPDLTIGEQWGGLFQLKVTDAGGQVSTDLVGIISKTRRQ